jgi:TetR/AcrR family fatty acid metabolism transcriptional regulator
MPHLTFKAKVALTEDRQRQILNAAVRVFSQKGYATATIRDIARAARVADGTIYNYFRSKDDLLIHIPRHIAGPIIDRLALELPEARTLQDAERTLTTFGTEMVRRILANIRFVKIFLSAIPHLSPNARDEYLRMLPLSAADAVEAHLRKGMAAGVYREDLDAPLAARTLPGLMFLSVVMQEVLSGGRPRRYDYDAIIRENVLLFLSGARSRVQSAPRQQEVRHTSSAPPALRSEGP